MPRLRSFFRGRFVIGNIAANSNLSGGSAAGQCVHGACIIVTSLTRSIRYCVKKVLDNNRLSLPSAIMMRFDY